MLCVGRRSWVSLQMDICHKRFVASIACSWLSQSTWSNWADDHIASFLILSRSAEECTADLSRKKTTVGRVPGYVGLPEGRARPGASRSKIVVNFYRTKSNNDDPLND